MNDANTEKLIKAFPEFLGIPKSPKEGAMYFGFECGDGWYQIIYDMCTEIVKIAKEHNILLGPSDNFEELGLYVVQIKEKFGTLRVYTSGTWDAIQEVIDKAEMLSGITCEGCGLEGSRRSRAWIQTLCEKCHEVD